MIIETTAPIAIDELKKHFENNDVSYLIDYHKSELKGEKLLTYLSNLDLPCDLKNWDYSLLKDYFNSTSILNCKVNPNYLNKLVIFHLLILNFYNQSNNLHLFL